MTTIGNVNVDPWHVVYTDVHCGGLMPAPEGVDPKDMSQRKTVLVAELERKGFAVYRPLYRHEKRIKIRVQTPEGRGHKHVVVTLWRGLFPRYLFVRIPAGRTLWEVEQTPHIVATLRSAKTGEAAKIADWKVRLLMKETEEGTFDQLLPAAVDPTAFAQPRPVKVGPLGLDGQSVGVQEDVKEGGKVAVVINLFGRECFMRVPLDKLQLAS